MSVKNVEITSILIVKGVEQRRQNIRKKRHKQTVRKSVKRTLFLNIKKCVRYLGKLDRWARLSQTSGLELYHKVGGNGRVGEGTGKEVMNSSMRIQAS